jgi:HTH-type transcriptional regulator/antitoxin HipB
LARSKTIAGLPERNHEDVVKQLLLLLGFDSAMVLFQVGRIHVCIRALVRRPLCVFEVKCSVAKASKRDGALRQARGLSQEQAGALLGVSQKRMARIEAAPGRASLDQVAKLVALLGGRLSIQDSVPVAASASKPTSAQPATW